MSDQTENTAATAAPSALDLIKAQVAAIRRRRELDLEWSLEAERLEGEREKLRVQIRALQREAHGLENAPHTPEDIREVAIRLISIPFEIKALERAVAAIVDPPGPTGGREPTTTDESGAFLHDVCKAVAERRLAPIRGLMAGWGGKAPEGPDFIAWPVLSAACPVLERLSEFQANLFNAGFDYEELLCLIEKAE